MDEKRIVIDDSYIKIFYDYQTYQKYGRPPGAFWEPANKCWAFDLKRITMDKLNSLKNWIIVSQFPTSELRKLEAFINEKQHQLDWVIKIDNGFINIRDTKLTEEQRKSLDAVGFKYNNKWYTWYAKDSIAARVLANKIVGTGLYELKEKPLIREYKLRTYLHPFQHEAYITMLKAYEQGWPGFLLADEMGLGKTVQSIAFAATLLESGDVERCLVITPKSVKHQWASEFKKFENMDSKIYEASGDLHQMLEEKGVILTHFEALKSMVNKVIDSLDEIEKIPSMKNALVIIDEASKIKNMKTANFKISKRLAGDNFKLLLTGTPYENRLEDFKNLMEFITPGFFGYKFFRDYFCILGTVWNQHLEEEIEVVTGYKNLKLFHTIVSPFMLRRVKKEVAKQLPEKIIENYHIDASALQKRIINYVRNLVQTDDEETMFKWIQNLRVIEDDPFLTTNELLLELLPSRESENPKYEALLDILEELDDEEQLIVFTQFAKMAQKIVEKLKTDTNRKVFLLTGEHSHKEDILEKFKKTKGAILCATDTLAYGVNLADVNYLVNIDLPWNPAVWQQRINRIHRLSSTTTKMIYNFVLVATEPETTVEQLVEHHIYEKTKAFTEVVEGGIDRAGLMMIASQFFGVKKGGKKDGRKV